MAKQDEFRSSSRFEGIWWSRLYKRNDEDEKKGESDLTNDQILFYKPGCIPLWKFPGLMRSYLVLSRFCKDTWFSFRELGSFYTNVLLLYCLCHAVCFNSCFYYYHFIILQCNENSQEMTTYGTEGATHETTARHRLSSNYNHCAKKPLSTR